MLRIPKHGTLALELHHAFACRDSADDDVPDTYRWSFRHAVIRAVSTAIVVVILVIVFLL